LEGSDLGNTLTMVSEERREPYPHAVSVLLDLPLR